MLPWLRIDPPAVKYHLTISIIFSNSVWFFFAETARYKKKLLKKIQADTRVHWITFYVYLSFVERGIKINTPVVSPCSLPLSPTECMCLQSDTIRLTDKSHRWKCCRLLTFRLDNLETVFTSNCISRLFYTCLEKWRKKSIKDNFFMVMSAFQQVVQYCTWGLGLGVWALCIYGLFTQDIFKQWQELYVTDLLIAKTRGFADRQNGG